MTDKTMENEEPNIMTDVKKDKADKDKADKNKTKKKDKNKKEKKDESDGNEDAENVEKQEKDSKKKSNLLSDTEDLELFTLKDVSDVLLSPIVLLIAVSLVAYNTMRGYSQDEQTVTRFIGSSFVWTFFLFIIAMHAVNVMYGVTVEHIIIAIMRKLAQFWRWLISDLFLPEIPKQTDEGEKKKSKSEKDKNEKKDKNSDAMKKEVFHIPGNNYSYGEARELCEAYDSKLATYDEIEKAYNNGAEWCSYGWSEGQMAYFPTQKDTFTRLQGTDTKNKCGRQGVNGGYFENPNMQFGVNCYGVKPNKRDVDKMYNVSELTSCRDPKAPKTSNKFTDKIGNISIAGFNYNNWNRVERV